MATTIRKFLLSLGYDPDIDLYRERVKMRKAKSKGIERFAIELFGGELVTSIAFALDLINHRPKKFPTAKVSTIRRTRNVSGVPEQTRIGFRSEIHRSHSTFTPFDSFWSQFKASPDNEIVIDGRGSIALDKQDSLLGYIKDTTVRTRDHGVLQGEMEKFVPRYRSPPASYSRVQSDNLIITNLPSAYYETTRTWEDVRYGFLGPSMRVTVDSYHTFVNQYMLSLNNLLSEHVLDLVSRTLPSKRKYTLTRNIVELKDLPKLYRDSLLTFKKLREGIVNLPPTSELYLNYQFGYRQLVSDIRNLLKAPADIAKEMNFFISRQGRPTNLRAYSKFSRLLAFHPAFDTEVFNLFDEPAISSRQETNSSDQGTLRCSINCNIEFPKVDIPVVREISYFAHKLGAELTPGDLYDLIPWTWLVDWFTGASEYFHMLEEISYDPSIINYGLISVKTTGKSLCQYISDVEKTNSVVESVPYHSDSYQVRYSAFRYAEFSWRSYVRKDLTTVMDSLKTSSGKGLSPYQTSILTALAGKGTKPESVNRVTSRYSKRR